MKSYQLALVLLFAALLFGSIIYLEIGVWNECRATNSWFYCFRIMGK